MATDETNNSKNNNSENGFTKVLKYMFLTLFFALSILTFSYVGVYKYNIINLLCFALFLSILYCTIILFDKQNNLTNKNTSQTSYGKITYASNNPIAQYIIVGFLLFIILISLLLPTSLKEKGIFDIISKIFGGLNIILCIFLIIDIARIFILVF